TQRLCRLLNELAPVDVEVTEAKGGFGGMGGANYGASRFDDMTHFGSGYTTPGWQRAQRRAGGAGGGRFDEDLSQDYDARPERGGAKAGRFAPPPRPGPLTIQHQPVAQSTRPVSDFSIRDPLFPHTIPH